MEKKLTVLYQRLSKDDPNGGDGESNSIINQRDMLVKYAEQNGFTPYICLSDDGQRTRAQKGYYKCSSKSLSSQKFNLKCSPHQIRVENVLDIIREVLLRTTR